MKAEFTLGRIIIFGLHVDKLKSFYVDNFNLSIIQEVKDQWIVLNGGQVELAIHRIGHDYEINYGKEFKADGNTKLVFQLAGDLTTTRQELISKGVSIGDIKSFNGINSLFCDGEDPEGNIFQIEQKLRK